MTKHIPTLEPDVLSDDGFVLRPRQGRRVLHATVAGANRGARAAVDALAALNANSTAMTVVPHYVDPVGGRAESLAEAAHARGLDGATGITSRIQDEDGLIRASDLVIHHLDRADAIAASHAMTLASNTPSLSYLAMLLPARGVIGVAAAKDGTNPDASAQIDTFVRGVARVSARAGSGAVFGPDAPVESSQAESLIRAWFARHTEDTVSKIAAGVALTRAPLELTFDGDESIQLFVVESDVAASSPETLAEVVLMNPHTPIPRGSRFVVCEVLPDTLRFVTVRHRSFGGVNVTGETRVTERDVVAARTTPRAAGPGLGAALLSLVIGASLLVQASRTNPIHTTD